MTPILLCGDKMKVSKSLRLMRAAFKKDGSINIREYNYDDMCAKIRTMVLIYVKTEHPTNVNLLKPNVVDEITFRIADSFIERSSIDQNAPYSAITIPVRGLITRLRPKRI